MFNHIYNDNFVVCFRIQEQLRRIKKNQEKDKLKDIYPKSSKEKKKKITAPIKTNVHK